MTRRELLRAALGSLAASLLASAPACSGEDGSIGEGTDSGGSGGDDAAAADGGIADGAGQTIGDAHGDAPGDAADEAQGSDATTNTCVTQGAKNGKLHDVPDFSGHALIVPAADILAGVEKTYSIQGSSGHEHMVTLSASDFASLQQGTSVTVTSTTSALHAHMVPVLCA